MRLMATAKQISSNSISNNVKRIKEFIRLISSKIQTQQQPKKSQLLQKNPNQNPNRKQRQRNDQY